MLNFLKKKNTKQTISKEYQEFEDIYNFCKEFTMTDIERMFTVYKATEYIVKNNIPGDIVECGVWRGGSTMVILKTLQKFGDTSRKVWLFDTYEGMSEPTLHDKDLNSTSAKYQLDNSAKESSVVWAYASLEDVKKNIASTNYPIQNVQFIKGKVEDTLPNTSYFSQLALLRLDTDWYESTKIELEVLYPLLVKMGVLIIDDYGHWQGCQKAVDDYFTKINFFPFLQRIDYTGRVFVKPS